MSSLCTNSEMCLCKNGKKWIKYVSPDMLKWHSLYNIHFIIMKYEHIIIIIWYSCTWRGPHSFYPGEKVKNKQNHMHMISFFHFEAGVCHQIQSSPMQLRKFKTITHPIYGALRCYFSLKWHPRARLRSRDRQRIFGKKENVIIIWRTKICERQKHNGNGQHLCNLNDWKHFRSKAPYLPLGCKMEPIFFDGIFQRGNFHSAQ